MKIFLSAVSGQFKACRDALRSDLSAVGAEVVVQEAFQQHGASLLGKLERYIASCDRIIALVGDAYGFESEETARPAGQPRRIALPRGISVSVVSPYDKRHASWNSGTERNPGRR